MYIFVAVFLRKNIEYSLTYSSSFIDYTDLYAPFCSVADIIFLFGIKSY